MVSTFKPIRRKIIYIIWLRWLRWFLKPINIKKEKSVSKAEITSFLLVCIPLGLTKQMKEKKNVETRTFNAGSYGRSAIQRVHFPYLYELKIYNFFINKVVTNSSLFIDYDRMLKNNDHQRNFRENFMHKMKKLRFLYRRLRGKRLQLGSARKKVTTRLGA